MIGSTADTSSLTQHYARSWRLGDLRNHLLCIPVSPQQEPRQAHFLQCLSYQPDRFICFRCQVRRGSVWYQCNKLRTHNFAAHSYIPENAWQRLGTRVSLPSPEGFYAADRGLPRLEVAVLGVSGELVNSRLHFNLGQAVLTARRLGALRTLLTGFRHGYAHQTWLDWCTEFGSHVAVPPAAGDRLALRGMPLWWKWPKEEDAERGRRQFSPSQPARNWTRVEFAHLAHESVRLWESETCPTALRNKRSHLHGIHIRPAFDGMVLKWREWDVRSAHVWPEWAKTRVVEEAGQQGRRGAG